MDINKTVVIGRLTRDPEMAYSQSGTPIAKFSIAVNGMKDDDVSFFDCVSFKKTAELVSQYLTKGARVGIDGKLQQNRWEDKDGNKRSKIEIIVNTVQFLSSKNEDKPPF